jgi:hypothetical protein
MIPAKQMKSVTPKFEPRDARKQHRMIRTIELNRAQVIAKHSQACAFEQRR